MKLLGSLATVDPRIDILILADGWPDGPSFEAACQQIVSGLYRIEPFRACRNRINVFVDYQPSGFVHEEYEDARPPPLGVYKVFDVGVPYWRKGKTAADTDKTRFGFYFDSGQRFGRFNGGATLLTSSREDDVDKRVAELSFEARYTTPPFKLSGKDVWQTKGGQSYGLVCVLLPNQRRGGTTRQSWYFVMSVGDDPVGTFAHELGHALGLDDEYEYGDQVFEKDGLEVKRISYELPVDFSEQDSTWPSPNVVRQFDFSTMDRHLEQGLTDDEIKKLPWVGLMTKSDQEVHRSGAAVVPHTNQILVGDKSASEYVFFTEPDIQADDVRIGKIPSGSYSPAAYAQAVETALKQAGRHDYSVQLDAGALVIKSKGQFRIRIGEGDSMLEYLFWQYAQETAVYTPARTELRSRDKITLTETPPDDSEPDLGASAYYEMRLVEGGNYVRRGAWRSNRGCLMRFHSLTMQSHGYCKVCHAHLYERITGRKAEYLLGDPMK